MSIEKLRISEIFHSIQGEGTRTGFPAVFVRLTGCNLRCTWCDSTYSFTGGTWWDLKSLEEHVRSIVRERAVDHVCITGGEPLLQPAVVSLMQSLLSGPEPLEVVLETSGSLSLAQVPRGVVKIVDFKAPGSGEESQNFWDNVHLLEPYQDEVKFVLKDRADYEWACGVVDQHKLLECHAVLFSPVHGVLDPQELAAWILADARPVMLQLQAHKYIWGADAQGV